MFAKRLFRKRSLALLLIGACCSAEPIVAGQQEAPLSVEHALKIESFGPLTPVQFSPNGKWLAFTLQDNQRTRSVDDEAWARTGVRGFNTGTGICIVSTESGKIRNLTGKEGDSWLSVWSPDSHYLAFLSNRDNSGQARLWIWDALKDELRRVSAIDARAEQIAWLPNSKAILVTTLPQGLSIDDYVKLRVSSVPNHTRSNPTFPGSTAVVYEAPASGKEDESQPSAPWNLNWALRDLVAIDISTGESTLLVSRQRIVKFSPSPNGAHIAYTNQKRFQAAGSQQILFDLVVVDRLTLHEQVVASDIPLFFPGEFTWSPNGSQLSFLTGGADELANDCYVVDINGRELRNITRFPKQLQHLANISVKPLWDTTGACLYFVRNGTLWRAFVNESKAAEVVQIRGRQIVAMVPQLDNMLWTTDRGETTVVITRDEVGKKEAFYKVDLSIGRATAIREANQCYSCGVVEFPEQLTAVSNDGERVAYFVEDAGHPLDLWMTDARFIKQHRLTHLNPQFDDCKLGTARLIDWLSADGESLQGALLLPSHYQEGKRYPLMVYVYGGRSISDYFNRFGFESRVFNLQLLATRGYAVFLPDAPQHLGTPMLDLAKTVLPGINRLIELGIADPERLGVMGHSYGGYSVLSLLVQTRRFKVAIAADGSGDLTGQYGAMDNSGNAFGVSVLERGQGLMGGTPWQDRERYIENSPLFYFYRVETPLLVVHGAQDTVVPSYLGDEVFVALRRLGKEVQYAKYEGEGHAPFAWQFSNQVDLSTRIIAWVDKYLKR